MCICQIMMLSQLLLVMVTLFEMVEGESLTKVILPADLALNESAFCKCDCRSSLPPSPPLHPPPTHPLLHYC